ncbi:MAG: hypothetical protein ACR2JF_08170 [Iamia sp.]
MTTSVAPLALARLVARVAGACDGVEAVAPALPGVAATHGPGGRVPGVVVHPLAPGGPSVTVHVRVSLGRPLPAVADEIRRATIEALAQADPDRAPWTVDVHIADVVLAGPASLS